MLAYEREPVPSGGRRGADPLVELWCEKTMGGACQYPLGTNNCWVLMPISHGDYYSVIARRDDHNGAERMDSSELPVLRDKLLGTTFDCLFHECRRNASSVLMKRISATLPVRSRNMRTVCLPLGKNA